MNALRNFAWLACAALGFAVGGLAVAWAAHQAQQQERALVLQELERANMLHEALAASGCFVLDAPLRVACGGSWDHNKRVWRGP